MNKQNQQRDAFVDEFHQQLGRLVHAHASFDFSIGLQLNWLGPHFQRDVTKLLNPRQSQLCTRLKELERLVLSLYEPGGKIVIAEFREWFKRAKNSSAIRNDYVHGRWGAPGKYESKSEGKQVDAKPLLTFTPLHWNTEPNRPDSSISMTLEDFSSQVDVVERLLGDYFQLTRKYVAFAKPRELLESDRL